ncbi:MAG: hypothetical protein WCW40_00555 [Bacteroidota bacterium]|jgi:hypothetical protein
MIIWKCFLNIDIKIHPEIIELIHNFEVDLQMKRKNPSNQGVDTSIHIFKEYALKICDKCVKINLEDWDRIYNKVKNDPVDKSTLKDATKNIVLSKNNLLTLANLFDNIDLKKEMTLLSANFNKNMVVIQLTVSED